MDHADRVGAFPHGRRHPLAGAAPNVSGGEDAGNARLEEKRVSIEHTPSFVDGIGGKSMLPEMWPVASALLAGSLVVSIREAASAVKILAERNRVIAEGAGATSVAAAMSGKAGSGKVVAVVSGGNIDPAGLATILQGGVP